MKIEHCRGCCYCENEICTKIGKQLSGMMALRAECYGKHRCGYKKEPVTDCNKTEKSAEDLNPADFIDYSVEDDYQDAG